GGNAWPALQRMRLLDPKTFQFTDQANYLNHPPVYYALHALLGPKLEGRPQALLAHRLIDIGIAAIGFAALLGLGLAARFPRYEFYAYAIPLACIPVLVPLAGSINNDNFAFLGGALATLGAWQCVSTGRRGWFALALLGVVVAGWAKLTGLLLTAAMVSGVIAYLLWRKRLPWSWVAAAVFVLLLAAAPYFVFIVQYGSPTPETPAQIALIKDGARAAGWADLPRRSFAAYLIYFIVAFVAEWMPTLAPRSTFNYALLAIPVAALACAFAGIALSGHRVWRRAETALDVVVLAGTAAVVATFAIHVSYSYGRYVAAGWLMDAYPRYYLPLAAIVPLAGLSLLAAIESPRWRGALLGFLIAGPMIFRLFGAPFG
ncbi:MAG TPA: hypothetical protein VMF12_08910, partial [Xanthobacteraceae bacterium]|nr:hypothetical protein [Xanthobacteraceae bacterium]